MMGTGPLYAHLKCLAEDMNLGPQMILEETKDWHQAALLDCAVFFPNRNDHFSDLLVAGASEVVPISRNVQGIDEYIKDAYSGFVFDSDDIKSTAEALITLKNNPLLKSEMAKRFKTALTERYSPLRIADQYLNLWKGQEYRTQNFRRRAL
ncbi:glycosyltransferase family 1 protein [bacterium]|nr:glycosyltransferase family 1 protein [bacterium]